MVILYQKCINNKRGKNNLLESNYTTNKNYHDVLQMKKNTKIIIMYIIIRK